MSLRAGVLRDRLTEVIAAVQRSTALRAGAGSARHAAVSAAAPNETLNCTHQRSTVGYAARSTSAGMS